MVDFAVMGTPFTICHHFVTHVLPFSLPITVPGKNIVNCGTGEKKKQGQECAQEDIVENCRKNAYIDLEDSKLSQSTCQLTTKILKSSLYRLRLDRKY